MAKSSRYPVDIQPFEVPSTTFKGEQTPQIDK